MRGYKLHPTVIAERIGVIIALQDLMRQKERKKKEKKKEKEK